MHRFRSWLWWFAVVVLASAGVGRAVTWEESAPGVNGFTTVDRITWRDSKGLERELFFARSYPNSIVPQIMGYVTRLTWQPEPGAPRIVAEEDPSAINASNASGWGGTVLHMHWMQYGGANPYFGSGFSATTNKRDGFDFVQGPVFLGPHHLLFRVTYKQYTTLQKAEPRKFVDVTIDWFISDGLDHVVYALTLDASRGYLTDGVAFLNNSLAPYSLDAPASWKGTTDWAGGRDGPDGQSFGDEKLFVSNDMARWTYGGVNTVPFIWQWVTPARGRGDAEAGYVQTETYSQKRAGEGFAGGQSGSGTRMPVYPDLNGLEYSYQQNYFDNYQSKRLTWGTDFGLLYGGGGATPGYQNYSLALHLGKFSDQGVPRLLQETEAVHDGTLSVRAISGTLRAAGPEGSGNPTLHLYSPAGFNAVYRTWEFTCAGPTAAIAFDVSSGSYARPVFVVRGYTANVVGPVRLNGELLGSGDFMASLDAARDTLYVTLLATLQGTNVIEFAQATGGGPQPSDAGTLDAGRPDAGTLDAGRPDAGTLDAGRPDAGTLDAGRPDAGTLDAGRPDAAVLDAGILDAGRPDAGTLSCTLPDGDDDGVCDTFDNCTGCYNPEQLDADRDGLGDCWRCDWCIGPGTDTDYDGFCDARDNCSTAWNQSQNDSDGDGVGDACDNCVATANPTQTDTNANGVGDACEAGGSRCSDRLRNDAETDVDCGGSTCGTCASGLRCTVNRDCASASCRSGRCR